MVKITTPLFSLLILATVAAGQEPKVHALFVVDSFSDVGRFVQIDKRNALRAIHGGFRDANQLHRLSWTVLEGATATPQHVIQHLRGLRPGPEDTIFFYYAGHGANEQGRGHFLRMSAGRLNRATLKQEIDRHNVRLKIILTESCSNMVPPTHLTMKPGTNTGDWETLSQLFFSGTGTVDVNSCRPGQIARAGGGTGALWTHCLSDVLCCPGNGPTNWQSILNAVNGKLQHMVPQHLQTACVYSLGEQTGGPVQPSSMPATEVASPQQQRSMPLSMPEFAQHHQPLPFPMPQLASPQQQPMSLPMPQFAAPQPHQFMPIPMPNLPNPAGANQGRGLFVQGERGAGAEAPQQQGGVITVLCVYPPRTELD